MSSNDNYTTSLCSLQQSFRTNQLAHAYMVMGPPRGLAQKLVMDIAKTIYCDVDESFCGDCRDCNRIEERHHPDMHWLEPESKSRRILKDDIQQLIRRLSQTSYEGGWKIAVILYAERLNPEAANAFLKTLEEPFANTLILLVTEEESAIMDTIHSRCQKVHLTDTAAEEETAWREPVLDLLRQPPRGGPVTSAIQAGYLQAIMDRLKADFKEDDDENEEVDSKVKDARENARFLELRSKLLRFMLNWHRDVLLATLGVGPENFHFSGEAKIIMEQAAGMTYEKARLRMEKLEDAARRLERNLPSQMVFEYMFAS